MLIILILFLINFILAVFTVFRQSRNITSVWAWLLVLTFFPIIGFIIYGFIGRQLTQSQLYKLKSQNERKVKKRVKRQLKFLNDDKNGLAGYPNVVKMFLKTDEAPIEENNEVNIFTEGKKLYQQMYKDIENAKNNINVEFYTIYSDDTGKEFIDALVRKQKQGVTVHLIYDEWGSIGTNNRFFKPLVKAGGYADRFLHTHNNLLNFRVNFRDHHKIIVIDGKIGYLGGYNIGDQYLDKKAKFGKWRDTSIRIVGPAVNDLQRRFIISWNATDKKHPINSDINYKDHVQYFPTVKSKGNVGMQIVSSGPQGEKGEQIKWGYVKYIQMARKHLWIQTPYLIPDDSVLDALKIAATSGVDVRIMVPNKPDHPFVYRATQYYVKLLTQYGVKVYCYEKGFIHAKTITVDNKYASIGTANMDYRSFTLNFELNAFIYNEKIARELTQQFKDDLSHSTLQTSKILAKQSWWTRVKQEFSRLLSPIL